MSDWIPLQTNQMPRKGEIIAIKGFFGVYPYLLIVENSDRFWRYNECYNQDTGKFNGVYSGTYLSFHGLGITHWKLIDSPY